jgi:hypothetical protein
MAAKALDLFKAYADGQLPQDGGYIVSSFFSENSAYTKYEVIAYPSVKQLFLTEDGLTFQSDGNKIHVLVEPATYHKKYIEPFRRDSAEQVPHRFSELETLTTRNQTKIMVSKEPIATYTTFTVFKPTGVDFAFVFFKLPDVLDSIKLFFEKSLNKEARVPTSEASRAAALVIDGVKKFTIFDTPV